MLLLCAVAVMAVVLWVFAARQASLTCDPPTHACRAAGSTSHCRSAKASGFSVHCSFAPTACPCACLPACLPLQAATRLRPSMEGAFELSIGNADKGLLSLEEIKRRVSQFTASGLPLVVTQVCVCVYCSVLYCCML